MYLSRLEKETLNKLSTLKTLIVLNEENPSLPYLYPDDIGIRVKVLTNLLKKQLIREIDKTEVAELEGCKVYCISKHGVQLLDSMKVIESI